MQIMDKGGKVTIKLDQAEGRRMRDAAYISNRIAANLTDSERVVKLKAAASIILAAADEFTPELSQAKLDKQDAEQPEVPARKRATST